MTWREFAGRGQAGNSVEVMPLSPVVDASERAGEEVAAGRGPAGRDGVPVAALDLGTHSCHLVIAVPEDRGFRVVERFSRTVGLGEGLGETGCLSAAAMERAIEVLDACAARLAARRVAHARCVATEAVRVARNRDAFVERARTEAGIALETIDPREEARLVMVACASHMDPAWKNALVFDIGAGSVELAWARQRSGGGSELAGWTSLSCGVAVLRDSFRDPGFDRDQYQAVVRSVAARFESFEGEFGIRRKIEKGAAGMIGTGGAVTTVAAVGLGLRRFDRARIDGSWLDFATVRRLRREMAPRSIAARAAHPCVGADRAELVVPGLAVLEAIDRAWPAGRLRVSNRGIHDGILNEMSASPSTTDAPSADAGGIPEQGRRTGRAT